MSASGLALRLSTRRKAFTTNMPRFRYEAVDRLGIPIHGTTEAESESALVQFLAARGQTLVSASELTLNALVAANKDTLPRLYQLRIGEQLREAILTGLPAHAAVRAIAAEPLTHPMLGVAPWLQVVALLLFAFTGGGWFFAGWFPQLALATAVFAFAIVPLIWCGMTWLYRTRPRQLLHKLADRLEAGESIPYGLRKAMPSELQSVMKSGLNDDSKGRVAADLVPTLQGSRLNSYQFVFSMLGPLILLSGVLLLSQTMLLYVFKPLKKIFDDFGMDLPLMTQALVRLSDMVNIFGTTGLVLACVTVVGVLVLIAVTLSSEWAAEPLSKIPGLGLTFRWRMQARVARILSSMIRNDCPYSDALKTATAGSGFEGVQEQGFLQAEQLESNSEQVLPMHQLSGLPIAMLSTTSGESHTPERKAAIADTFQSLSEMMDAASVGHGRLLAVFLQFFTILTAGTFVVFAVVAMFLPLIKLLNDLS